MRSEVILSLCALLILIASCFKPKEPRARICPEEPLIITTLDSLVLENCSEHAESQRWDLPNGAFSTQNKVAVTSAVPTTYNITLSVSNNDYANDYITTRTLKIVSAVFSTSTINLFPATPGDTVTACTQVDDLDANDPDGYYVTAGAPPGYLLLDQQPNGCFRYSPDPQNPPAGKDSTYQYYCINDKYCDTTKVIFNN